MRLNGTGCLVTKDVEKAEAVDAFFTSVLYNPARLAFSNPKSTRPVGKLSTRLTLGGGAPG